MLDSNNITLKEFLDQDQKKDLLRVLIAGSVDDGKSTLLGRLLFDLKSLYKDQIDDLLLLKENRGDSNDTIDFALLTDGLKAEREQGITIDVAYRYFSTSKREFIVADSPGHEQYTRNMITGGSTADLAIILIDASKGVLTQTKRHTYLISLLGIKDVVLAVNKMDLVKYSEDIFDKIRDEYSIFARNLNIPNVYPIPISALKGENIVTKSKKVPWYEGNCLLEYIEEVSILNKINVKDLRVPVQYIIKAKNNYRGITGKIVSGVLRKGDEIMVLPSGKRSKIKSLLNSGEKVDLVFPPASISFTLEDEIDISRGDMIVHTNNTPKIERHIEAILVWMNEDSMNINTQYLIKQNTHLTKVRIDEVSYRININTLEKDEIEVLELNEIGRIVLTTSTPLMFDPYENNKHTGSFILIDPVSFNTVAVGMIIDKVSRVVLPSRITSLEKKHIYKRGSLINQKAREKVYGQRGVTLWITGLHASRKNELAYSLEKELFSLGKTVVVIDGTSVRLGLSKELDFSPVDRAEHLRRVAHVCRLLNDQGIITICSFISPLQRIRNQVEKIINSGLSSQIIDENRFELIYMDANLDFCKNRDKLDLYKKAELGEIDNLPGVDIEYEIPHDPDLIIRTNKDQLDLEAIIDYLSKRKIIF